MRVVAWLIVVVVGILGTLYFGYATLYWAGVTATPLTPAGLSRAQRNFYLYLCLALTASSFVGAIGALVFAVRSAPGKVRRGFDALT